MSGDRAGELGLLDVPLLVAAFVCGLALGAAMIVLVGAAVIAWQ